jgi:hypothetical protein
LLFPELDRVNSLRHGRFGKIYFLSGRGDPRKVCLQLIRQVAVTEKARFFARWPHAIRTFIPDNFTSHARRDYNAQPWKADDDGSARSREAAAVDA